MKGYMVVFFTQQNRRYQGKMLGEWIVDVAKEIDAITQPPASN